MSQEVMRQLSRRGRAWLGALAALAAAATIVIISHPKWENPVSTGIVLAGSVIVALGRLFEQSWTFPFALGALLAAIVVGFFELAMGSGGMLLAFLLLAILFGLAGRWSHYRWLKRPHFSYPLAKDENDEETGPRDKPPSAGRSLYDLRPRSRTSLLYACACLSVAVSLFGVGVQTGEEWLTVAVTMPEVILAVGLWTHANWVRWFGPLVCLAWVGLWAYLFLPSFEPFKAINLLPLVLLRLALAFRRWQWETPWAG
jgi:hypothetical protein